MIALQTVRIVEERWEPQQIRSGANLHDGEPAAFEGVEILGSTVNKDLRTGSITFLFKRDPQKRRVIAILDTHEYAWMCSFDLEKLGIEPDITTDDYDPDVYYGVDSDDLASVLLKIGERVMGMYSES